MTFADWSNTISMTLMWSSWVGALILLGSYGIFFRWYRTKAGRTFFQVLLSFALLLTLAVLARSTGDAYWGREILRPVAFAWITLSTVRVSVLLWAGWWRGEPESLKTPNRIRNEKR